MRVGAQTPEELETLFEDAFVVHDGGALSALFEDGALLAADGLEAQGGDAIAGLGGELCQRELIYLAQPRRIVQSRRSALVVSAQGVHVLRRGHDGAWRSSISLITLKQKEAP